MMFGQKSNLDRGMQDYIAVKPMRGHSGSRGDGNKQIKNANELDRITRGLSTFQMGQLSQIDFSNSQLRLQSN